MGFEALAKIGNKQALDAIVLQIPSWFAKNVNFESDYDGFSEEEMRKVAKIEGYLRKIFNSFDEEGRIALETAIVYENFVGKNVLARVLAVVVDDKSIPALIMALEKGDLVIKTEAVRALRRLKATAEVIPKIINELLNTGDFLIAGKEKRGNFSTEDRPARDTYEAFAKTILLLGSIDDWVTKAFHRPRIEDYAESFDQALINSQDKAVPALTTLLGNPDLSVQNAAAEMIAKIKKGTSENKYSYYRFDSRV